MPNCPKIKENKDQSDPAPERNERHRICRGEGGRVISERFPRFQSSTAFRVQKKNARKTRRREASKSSPQVKHLFLQEVLPILSDSAKPELAELFVGNGNDSKEGPD
jgi:hypothetical protein